MNNNIVGEEFDPWLVDQINTRQELSLLEKPLLEVMMNFNILRTEMPG
jgi:hypothetical protein